MSEWSQLCDRIRARITPADRVHFDDYFGVLDEAWDNDRRYRWLLDHPWRALWIFLLRCVEGDVGLEDRVTQYIDRRSS